jgi:enamine deaminase RidA (YjgF/YER057c/UK114 family)
MKRTNFSTNTNWESIVGYSRAVRIGNTIEVTGTVSIDSEGNLVGGDSAYEQTLYICSKIEVAIKKLGGTLKDVIRTRLYVTDISRWEEYGRAHGQFFSEIRPCTTMVEVKALISPEFLVEIEASAIVDDSANL